MTKVIFCLLSFVFCLLSFAFCLLSFAFCLFPFVICQQKKSCRTLTFAFTKGRRFSKTYGCKDRKKCQRTTDNCQQIFFELQLPHHVVDVVVKQSCYIIRFFFSKILEVVSFIKRQCCRISINSRSNQHRRN